MRRISLIYSADWKGEDAKVFVEAAIKAGFRRVHNAPGKHRKQERLVGNGLREVYYGNVKRNDVHVRTKLNPHGALRSFHAGTNQIHAEKRKKSISSSHISVNLPWKKQVKASVEPSLSNLRHRVGENRNDAYVDCMLLHMPKFTQKEIVQTWHILESYVPHQIRTLSLSHARYKDLERVWSMSVIRPSVVQNHLVPQERYDGDVRAFCRRRRISYQLPWTLNPTNNPRLLKPLVVTSLAQEAKVDAEIALYALVHAMEIEMLHVNPSLERTSDVLEGMAKAWEAWAEKYEFFRKIVESGQHDA
jgi:diketogulonate reductase-like aldo/keto reductase